MFISLHVIAIHPCQTCPDHIRLFDDILRLVWQPEKPLIAGSSQASPS